MKRSLLCIALVACLSVPVGISAQSGETLELTDAQMEELVRRFYQYVAMFNVNNKFALDPDNPMTTGGYNRTLANTELADHTLQAIARRNMDPDIIMRLYAPDLERHGSWTAPIARKLNGTMPQAEGFDGMQNFVDVETANYSKG